MLTLNLLKESHPGVRKGFSGPTCMQWQLFIIPWKLASEAAHRQLWFCCFVTAAVLNNLTQVIQNEPNLSSRSPASMSWCSVGFTLLTLMMLLRVSCIYLSPKQFATIMRAEVIIIALLALSDSEKITVRFRFGIISYSWIYIMAPSYGTRGLVHR